METGSSYAPPLGIVLEAIYIAPTRPPPDGAIYRGELESLKAMRAPARSPNLSTLGRGDAASQAAEGDEETPKPKRRRPQG